MRLLFKIKVAGFIIEIYNKYDFVKNQCEKYIYNGDGCDIKASCTYEQIAEEKEFLADPQYSDGYIESVCIYRNICLQLPENDAFVMHAAVIGVEDKAYAFTAKSGTGKSTHIIQWKKLLGKRVYAVNGDKPILRFAKGKLYACGTPWCGKENWNNNVAVELAGICFIERGEKNIIEKISTEHAAPMIMKQILLPRDLVGATKTLELADRMLKCTDLWRLRCNISLEAAEIAYNAMSGGKNEN